MCVIICTILFVVSMCTMCTILLVLVFVVGICTILVCAQCCLLSMCIVEGASLFRPD